MTGILKAGKKGDIDLFAAVDGEIISVELLFDTKYVNVIVGDYGNSFLVEFYLDGWTYTDLLYKSHGGDYKPLPNRMPLYIDATDSPVSINIEGSPSDDKIIGSALGDFIQCLGGQDKINGGGGDDKIWGSKGSQKLVGGSGDDVIAGHSGGDILRGGSGEDIFLFSLGNGESVIEDFDDRDSIWIQKSFVKNFDDLKLKETGDGVKIVLKDQDREYKTTIYLDGVEADSLSGKDFIFDYAFHYDY